MRQQMVKERIGRHEVICLLGEGGMAKVYLGFSRGPADVNKLLVMKVIRNELARDKRFVTLFLDEARLATRLNHPNVVQTYEVVEDAGQYILTMEYLEGQSLFDVFQRIELQFFPLEEHLWILTQVLAGLQYAHSLPDYNGSPLGVVHRDVSPDNTFVTYNGDVKLLDFGIAKASGSVSITNRGTFKGKLSYCAPEQLQGDDPPDARADIFSVGVMLWEALAGRRIEMGESFAKLGQTRLTGREPRIREIRPDVDPALAEICDRAMALRPTDRYLTAVAMHRNLERYLEKSAKRVGRAQLAELMRGHFELERRYMQKRIEEHLIVNRDAPAATGESPPGEGTSRESLLHTAVLSDNGSGAPRGLEGHTQEASSPPFVWDPKSPFLPTSVAASVSPLANKGFQAGSKRLLTRSLLILAAVLVGVSAVAIGLWKRNPKPVANAPISGEAPSSTTSPVMSNDSPQPTPPVIPIPAQAPSPERVGFASDVHLKAELRRPGSPVRGGTKPHHPQRKFKSDLKSKPQPSQIDRPGMDLGRPSIRGTSNHIDERNPYTR